MSHHNVFNLFSFLSIIDHLNFKKLIANELIYNKGIKVFLHSIYNQSSGIFYFEVVASSTSPSSTINALSWISISSGSLYPQYIESWREYYLPGSSTKVGK